MIGWVFGGLGRLERAAGLQNDNGFESREVQEWIGLGRGMGQDWATKIRF